MRIGLIFKIIHNFYIERPAYLEGTIIVKLKSMLKKKSFWLITIFHFIDYNLPFTNNGTVVLR